MPSSGHPPASWALATINATDVIKNKEYIGFLLGTISSLLTIIAKLTTLIPSLNTYVTILLFTGCALLMGSCAYISWSKEQGQFTSVFKYSKKVRSISNIFFLAIPIFSLAIWYFTIRLTSEEIEKRDRLVKLGNYYYSQEHHRKKALNPYVQALEIDPSQTEIILRIKELQNEIKLNLDSSNFVLLFKTKCTGGTSDSKRF